MIPRLGSDLDSVMSSLRQTDEKYQDASVSRDVDYQASIHLVLV